MSTSLAVAPATTSRAARSVRAVAVAFLVNAALSLAVDQILHVLDVYPPWGEPMHAPALNLLALAYRIAFGVGAGYLVAQLAPDAPVGHANVLGGIATVLSAAGAVAAIAHGELGPAWYPIALTVVAYPTVRLGAAWHAHRARRA